MDPQTQASFIPKKPLDAGLRRRGGFGLLFLIAFLIFIASLVAAGSAFAFQQYLQSQLASAQASLQNSESAYDTSAIDELQRLDDRINQAQILLQKHVAATGIFNFLASQTLANVAWGGFNYAVQADGTAKINLNGTADSFSTVALQSDQFNNNKLLKDVVFSGISAGSTGGIAFNVSATVDPSVILYSNVLGLSASVAPPSGGTAASTTP